MAENTNTNAPNEDSDNKAHLRMFATIEFSFDEETDCSYLALVPDISRGVVKTTRTCEIDDVGGLVNMDFDLDGKLMGIEVVGASKILPKEFLLGIFFEAPLPTTQRQKFVGEIISFAESSGLKYNETFDDDGVLYLSIRSDDEKKFVVELDAHRIHWSRREKRYKYEGGAFSHSHGSLEQIKTLIAEYFRRPAIFFVPETLEKAIGEHQIEQLNDLCSLNSKYLHGPEPAYNASSMATVEKFLAIFPGMASCQPSISISEGRNIILQWEDRLSRTIELEFLSRGIEYYIQRTDECSTTRLDSLGELVEKLNLEREIGHLNKVNNPEQIGG